jgi:PAS domain S-box-containing protein
MTSINLATKTKNTARMMLFFVFLTFAAIMGQTFMSVKEDRRTTLAAEEKNGFTAVRLLEEHAAQTLRDADRNLDNVSEALSQIGKQRAIDETVLSEIISKGKQDARYMNALQFVNPNGVSLVSSLEYPAHQIDAPDRPYIGFLLAHPKQKTTLVGRAFKRYYDNKLVVPVARNIHDKNGKFVGIISIDISITYFSDVYARIATGGKAVVALIADDGYVIVRSPFDARFLSLDISQSPIVKQLRDRKVEGSFEDTLFLGDNTPTQRLYTYRKIPEFNVTAIYARDFDTFLHDWRSRTIDNILYAGVFIAIHLVLTFFLAHHIKRLHTSEYSLQQNIERLHTSELTLQQNVERLHTSELTLQQNVERLNRSESSLRASETKFISMFQYSPVPLSVMRVRDELIFEANDSLLAQFGYQHSEFVGQTPDSLHLWLNPEEHDPYLELLNRQQFVENHEVQMRDKHGRVLFCLLSARIFDSDGEKMAIFSPIDVTRQREIEHEIRELNTQLEERVKQRTAKLENSNAELAEALQSLQNAQGELLRSEKMAALGSLVAGVAHELNTPIGNSVTVASTLNEWIHKMSDELGGPKPSRTVLSSGVSACVGGVDILVRNLDRAAELVMSFKQVAVDQSSNQRRHFDLRQSIEEVLLTLGPMYRKTPFKLEQDLEPNISMESYPGALGQVVTNFVTNALAHAFDGRTTGTMRISTHKVGNSARIVFSDDGVGIPEKFLARVFDPFFTTKLGQGGSGLGMHIVYNLVNGVLGGKIDLSSTPGVGTTLTVTLPLQAAMQEGEAAD